MNDNDALVIHVTVCVGHFSAGGTPPKDVSFVERGLLINHDDAADKAKVLQHLDDVIKQAASEAQSGIDQNLSLWEPSVPSHI